MSKYVIYTRVSTLHQGETHLGLSSQRRECEHYVAQKKAVIVAILEEVKSGSHKSVRPVVQEAIRLCKQHNAILLVSRLDRLGRSQVFLSSLKHEKIAIESAENGEMTAVVFGMMSVLAEAELEMISERIKAGLRQAKLKGKTLGKTSFGDHAQDGNKKRHEEAIKRHETVLVILSESRNATPPESYSQIASKLERFKITDGGKKYTPEKLIKLKQKYIN